MAAIKRRRFGKIDYAARKKIESGIKAGIPIVKIAEDLNIHFTSIYREIRTALEAEGMPDAEWSMYDADKAQKRL